VPARAQLYGLPMVRDAALEGAIAEDCDSPEPYMVYADWLQARGDVRGTWIALHDARRRGSNARVTTEIAELREHRGAELLGPLHMRNDVDLTWFQGFVRTIRFRGATIQAIESGLKTLVDNPVATFVQAIAIDRPEEPERVVRQLVKQKQPAQLANITIGSPSDWQVSKELVATFPKLERDPTTAWVAAVAASQGRRATLPDITELPELVAKPGIELCDTATILRGLRGDLDGAKPTGMVAALARAVTRDSLDQFTLAFATMKNAPTWASELLGALGGDRCARALGDAYREAPVDASLSTLDHLRRIDSDVSITELARIAAIGDTTAHRCQAVRDALELVALTREYDSLTQLIARTCPRRDSTELRGFQTRWLESLMVSGARLTAADFLQYVVSHSIRLPLATRIVWWDERPFVVDEDGLLRDVDGEHRVTGPVGIPHRLEVETSLRVTEPLFPQLERSIYSLDPVELQRDEIDRVADRKLTQARLFERGWYIDQDYNGDFLARDFPRDNVTLRIGVLHNKIDHADFHRGRHWEKLRLATISAITISEALFDLELATVASKRRAASG
jgi:uncharacterized protein (TIGR02996 family)